jgi:hypothetical protein
LHLYSKGFNNSDEWNTNRYLHSPKSLAHWLQRFELQPIVLAKPPQVSQTLNFESELATTC